MSTLGTCVDALVADGRLDGPDDAVAAMAEVNTAMTRCESAYSNWPLAFRFWKDWYGQFRLKLERDGHVRT